jgi:hypothetical protein
VELKRRGVPTELLLFPGEGHELSRTGRPRHRRARLDHVLRWWGRWLPTPQNSSARGALPAGSGAAAAVQPAVDGAPVDGEAPGRRTDTLTVPATRI